MEELESFFHKKGDGLLEDLIEKYGREKIKNNILVLQKENELIETMTDSDLNFLSFSIQEFRKSKIWPIKNIIPAKDIFGFGFLQNLMTCRNFEACIYFLRKEKLTKDFLNELDAKGSTPLIFAVDTYRSVFFNGEKSYLKKCLEVIALLVDMPEVNLNSQCKENGNTAMHLAVADNIWEVAEIFLKSGREIDFDIKNNFNETILDCAITNIKDFNNEGDSVQIILRLLLKKQRIFEQFIQIPNESKLSILYDILKNDDFTAFQFLCDKKLIDFSDENLIFILRNNVQKNIFNECLLFQKEFNFNLFLKLSRNKILGFISQDIFFKEKWKNLLDKMAKNDVNQKNEMGDTLLHLCIKISIPTEHKLFMIKSLLQIEDINVNIVDDNCISPLLFLVTKYNANSTNSNFFSDEDIKIVNLLLMAGADIYSKDIYGGDSLKYLSVHRNILLYPQTDWACKSEKKLSEMEIRLKKFQPLIKRLSQKDYQALNLKEKIIKIFFDHCKPTGGWFLSGHWLRKDMDKSAEIVQKIKENPDWSIHDIKKYFDGLPYALEINNDFSVRFYFVKEILLDAALMLNHKITWEMNKILNKDVVLSKRM